MTLREIRNNVAVVIAGLAGAFVLCELALRLLAAAGVRVALDLRAMDPLAVQVEPLGDHGFRQRPGARFAYRNGTYATVNELGYRGPAVAVPKPPGTFRVLLLGGSTTHGWSVGDSETIDHEMRRLLRERRPETASDVVNLAFDGYDSYQILLRLRHDGLRYDPDVVIVNAGNYDVANARYADLRDADPRTLIWEGPLQRLRTERAEGGPRLWDLAKHWLYATRLPQYMRKTMQDRAALQAGIQDRAYPDAADYFERNMTRIAEEASSRGAFVFLSSDPSSRQTLLDTKEIAGRSYIVVDGPTTQAYRDTLARRLKEVASRIGGTGRRVSYVSLDSMPASEFQDDAHPRAEGNRHIAEQFVEAVLPLLLAQGRTAAPQRAN